MPRVPTKLTRSEIVLPPRVAQQYRDRLEEMNRMGLQARALHRQAGGGVSFKDWAQQNRGAIGDLGAAFVNIGSGDFKGASAALARDKAAEKGAIEQKLAELERLRASGQIDQAQYDSLRGQLLTAKKDSATLKQEKADADAVQQSEDMVRLAREAGTLLQGASIAADFINGHRQNLTTKEQDELNSAEKNAGSRFKEAATGLISTAGGAFNATARVRDEALRKIAYRKYPDSYRDYTRLITIANKMVFPILESGALGVNPTDADTQLAKQSTFDVKAPSTTWAAQLNDLIAREGQTGNVVEVIVQELAQKTGNEQSVGQPVNVPALETELPDDPRVDIEQGGLPAGEVEEEEVGPLPGDTEWTKNVDGTKYEFVDVSNADVPEDVVSLWVTEGEPNKRVIQGDDGYYYVHRDRFFSGKGYWLKSRVKGGK